MSDEASRTGEPATGDCGPYHALLRPGGRVITRSEPAYEDASGARSTCLTLVKADPEDWGGHLC